MLFIRTACLPSLTRDAALTRPVERGRRASSGSRVSEQEEHTGFSRRGWRCRRYLAVTMIRSLERDKHLGGSPRWTAGVLCPEFRRLVNRARAALHVVPNVFAASSRALRHGIHGQLPRQLA